MRNALADERQAATEACHEWNVQHAAAMNTVLLPVKWETHVVPTTGVRPQEAINRQLVKDADILVGMFWTKLGASTGVAESGTVEEINQFVAAGRPAMLYFSSRPIDPNKIDIDQHQKLKAFKSQTYNNALCGSFTSLEELRSTLLRDLTRQIRRMKEAFRQQQEQPESKTADGTALEARRAAAQLEREAWEAKLLKVMYRNFKAKIGLVALCVIPAEPQKFNRSNDPYYYQYRLAPPSMEKGIPKRDMKADLVYWPTDDKPPTAMTELTDRGSVLTVKHMLWNYSPGHMQGGIKFRFVDYERWIAQATQRYLTTLVELGVKGPWFVGLSLLAVRNFQMSIGAFPRDEWRIAAGDDENILTDLLTIPADANVADETAVFDLLKPAYRQVWHAFHFPGRPGFRPDGSFMTYNG